MASLLRCGWRGGAVVEWRLTKIKKGRRKTLPKDHSHLNHMNSHYTRGRGWLPQVLTEISELMALYGVLGEFLKTTTI